MTNYVPFRRNTLLGPAGASLISHYECGSSLFSKQRECKRVIEKTVTKPEETLCMGDEIRDIEAAQEATVAFGAVTWDYSRPDALSAYPGISLFHTPDDNVRKVLEL